MCAGNSTNACNVNNNGNANNNSCSNALRVPVCFTTINDPTKYAVKGRNLYQVEEGVDDRHFEKSVNDLAASHVLREVVFACFGWVYAACMVQKSEGS